MHENLCFETAARRNLQYHVHSERGGSRLEELHLLEKFDYEGRLVGKGMWCKSNPRDKGLELVKELQEIWRGGREVKIMSGDSFHGNLRMSASILAILKWRIGSVKFALNWWNVASFRALIRRPWALLNFC